MACVDLRNANDLAEIAPKLLAQITVPKSLLKRERMLAIGRNTLAPIELAGGSFILSVDSKQDGATILGQVLDWMNSFAESEEMKTTVLLQEVDQLERIWGPRGDWWLRGTTQFHRSLNYVFLSSKKRLGMEGCLFRRRGRSLHCLLAARTALFFLGLLRSSVMVTVSLGCAPTLSTEVTRPRVPWKRINNLGNVTPTTESPKFAWLGRHRSMFTLRLHLADVMASSVLLFVFWSGSLTYYPA